MIVLNYYPFSEVRVRREAEALLEAGHSVDVICRRHSSEPKFETTGALTVHRLTVGDKSWGVLSQLMEYLTFTFLAFLKVTALHLKHRFDVVEAHNLPDFLVFAAIIPRLTGSRVLLNIHDLMPEFYCSRFKRPMTSLPARLLMIMEWLSCSFAQHVITVTDLWRETLIKRGVPTAKCFVVMNLADPVYFRRGNSASESSSQPLSVEPDTFRLIYHGTIAHRYGVDLLLLALQRVKKEIPNVSLRIHGRGEYVEAIRQMIQELGLAGNVQFTTDFLAPDALSELIQSADVGVVPYRSDIFTDGILPTKLLEYVALGVPAIAARTQVISHYFGEDSVEFFRPGDVDDLTMRILALSQDPERRRLLAFKSARFNDRYSWVLQKSNYVRLVEAGSEMSALSA
jgi:glycosyltransferase involved in cell wall biosynthesis